MIFNRHLAKSIYFKVKTTELGGYCHDPLGAYVFLTFTGEEHVNCFFGFPLELLRTLKSSSCCRRQADHLPPLLLFKAVFLLGAIINMCAKSFTQCQEKWKGDHGKCFSYYCAKAAQKEAMEMSIVVPFFFCCFQISLGNHMHTISITLANTEVESNYIISDKILLSKKVQPDDIDLRATSKLLALEAFPVRIGQRMSVNLTSKMIGEVHPHGGLCSAFHN